MTEKNKKQAIADISPTTNWIVERCKQLAVGEIVTYDQLHAACGQDVRVNRGYMQTARRILRDDCGIVMSCVITIGYKRLDNVGIIGSADHRIKGIRRSVRTACREIGTVDTKDLDQENLQKLLAKQAQLGALAMLSGHSATRKIEQSVEQKKLTSQGFDETVRAVTGRDAT